MPQMGEISRGCDVGYKTYAKRIWSCCEVCGKGRWVTLIQGKPSHTKCRRCKNTGKLNLNIEHLIQLYDQEKLSVEKVAMELGVSELTVWRRLNELGLTRSRKEAAKLGIRRGSKSPSWKGGRTHHEGYVIVYKPEHPKANAGYVPEHIVVWEQIHNRYLPKGWIVHHINGVKDDNRPRNLVAMPKNKHDKFNLLKTARQRVRELEVENRQLRKALENSQMIFYISGN